MADQEFQFAVPKLPAARRPASTTANLDATRVDALPPEQETIPVYSIVPPASVVRLVYEPPKQKDPEPARVKSVPIRSVIPWSPPKFTFFDDDNEPCPSPKYVEPVLFVTERCKKIKVLLDQLRKDQNQLIDESIEFTEFPFNSERIRNLRLSVQQKLIQLEKHVALLPDIMPQIKGMEMMDVFNVEATRGVDFQNKIDKMVDIHNWKDTNLNYFECYNQIFPEPQAKMFDKKGEPCYKTIKPKVLLSSCATLKHDKYVEIVDNLVSREDDAHKFTFKATRMKNTAASSVYEFKIFELSGDCSIKFLLIEKLGEVMLCNFRHPDDDWDFCNHFFRKEINPLTDSRHEVYQALTRSVNAKLADRYPKLGVPTPENVLETILLVADYRRVISERCYGCKCAVKKRQFMPPTFFDPEGHPWHESCYYSRLCQPGLLRSLPPDLLKYLRVFKKL